MKQREHPGQSEGDLHSLVPIQPLGTKPPFFAIHSQTGEVTFYQDLAHHLGPDQPFYGLQARGLDRIAEPLGSVDEMADAYIDEILSLQPSGPYLLGGYSFGGRVAYVMARKLRARGKDVPLLALLDSSSLFGQRRKSTGSWASQVLERLTSLPLREQPLFLARRIVNAGLIVWDRASLKLFIFSWHQVKRRGWPLPRILRRPLRANQMAKIAYRAEPYDGAAVLFRAELYNWGHPDAHDGWKKLVRGGLEIRDIPVPHHLILLEPQVSVLAKHLSQCLDDAVGDH